MVIQALFRITYFKCDAGEVKKIASGLKRFAWKIWKVQKYARYSCTPCEFRYCSLSKRQLFCMLFILHAWNWNIYKFWQIFSSLLNLEEAFAHYDPVNALYGTFVTAMPLRGAGVFARQRRSLNLQTADLRIDIKMGFGYHMLFSNNGNVLQIIMFS